MRGIPIVDDRIKFPTANIAIRVEDIFRKTNFSHTCELWNADV